MNTKVLIMAVIALAVIGIAAMQLSSRNASVPEAAMTTQTTDSTDEQANAGTQLADQGGNNTGSQAEAGSLKDGTYSADGDYLTPAGQEVIGVTVTLKDGLITEAEVETQANHETSKRMQASFKEGYKELVIGKPITEVELDRVSASSLTSDGFNEALQKIIQEAQG